MKKSREYELLYSESIENPELFWSTVAKDLHWYKKWDKVLEWKPPHATWFKNGTTNISYNCLDRHISAGQGDKIAIIWEGETESLAGKGGNVRKITYAELRDLVCKCANGLKKLGVRKGSRVTIYLPMIPEAVVAMLACSRIGAIHSVIFGGFSSQAILDRIKDAKSEIVITADGGWRRGAIVPLKHNIDEALSHTNIVKTVIVLKHTLSPITMVPGRDVDWKELVDDESTKFEAEQMDSEDPLFVLYTSGSTGKPKGIVHTTGGYMVGTYLTFKHVFDIKADDIYFCTADVGWITGHSYVVYGPLINGATIFMYEGAPNFPNFSRLFAMIERHSITIFYTAPTAIRLFMRAGREFIDAHNLKSLRLLGTVGEPINPEVWKWYHEVVGGGRCPIVDTWWQTETGMIMVSSLPGKTGLKAGSAGMPFFGVDAAIVDETGKEVASDHNGFLVIRKPWPSMLRTILNDPDRYVRQYWKEIPGVYFTGDGARKDTDGYYWITGRVDDVLNVSGHRLGSAEIENALLTHHSVAEAAVIGVSHEIKGQSITAFVTLRSSHIPSEALKEELIIAVRTQVGAMASPDQIRFTNSLPKTRSGKIMRRLLRELATGAEIKGDITTLEDISAIKQLKEEK